MGQLRDGLLLQHGGLGVGVGVLQLSQQRLVGLRGLLRRGSVLLRRLLRRFFVQLHADVPAGGVGAHGQHHLAAAAQRLCVGVVEHGGHDPVQHAAGADAALRPGLHAAGKIAHLAHQRQALPRAGHQYVEYAHLLGDALPPPAQRDGAGLDGLVHRGLVRVAVVQRKSPLAVAPDVADAVAVLAPVVAGAEARAQPRADDDGELQPLGLVHRHDAHHVVVLGKGGHVLLAVAAGGRGDAAQEVAQAQARRVVLGGALGQGAQVGGAHAALGQRGKPHEQPRLLQHGRAQRGQAVLLRQAAHALQLHGKAARLFAQRFVGAVGRVARQAEPHAAVLVPAVGASAVQADLRQLLRVKIAHAVQRAQQVHVLQRVVHRPEVVHHLQNLGGLVEIAAAARVDGDAVPGKHLHVLRQHRQHGPSQHHDVAKARGAFGAVGVVDGRAHQAAHQPRHRLDLAADGLAVLLVAAALAVDELEDGGRAVGGVLPAGMQRGVLVVVHAGGLLRHAARKDAVDGREHVPCRAEVAVERDELPARARLVAPLLGQEQRRVALAEAVDGLLDVADVEHVVPPADARQNRLLHQ